MYLFTLIDHQFKAIREISMDYFMYITGLHKQKVYTHSGTSSFLFPLLSAHKCMHFSVRDITWMSDKFVHLTK